MEKDTKIEYDENVEHDVKIDGYYIVKQSSFYGICIRINVDGEQYEDSITIEKNELE